MDCIFFVEGDPLLLQLFYHAEAILSLIFNTQMRIFADNYQV